MSLSKKITLPLRAIQGVFALVVLALSGYVAHWYNTTTVISSPSEINFLFFCSLWSLLSIATLEILIPRVIAPKTAASNYIALGVELSNILFWFSGFVALATFLSKLLFCRGSVCQSAQADVAFAAAGWLIWTGTGVLMVRDVMAKGGLAMRPSWKRSGAGSKQPVEVPATKEEV
ncbi:membrane-associating domain-containing protein [Triangularia verruculosa]|uniref:Membrane-associating domain-containing protein n=1 Tax=Triangularia verruculosa TaxID=2587418 RepID=A0AAN6XBQ9_9PEZI|nr:membrane-associating domain-containing protein [Triangularia verruculosa]